MNDHTRARVQKAALDAAKCLDEYRARTRHATADCVDGWYKAIVAEVCAAWQDYHAACIKVPASDLAEIMSTGEALAAVVKAAGQAAYGVSKHDQTRSEGGTEPAVPAPHEPLATGAGTAERLP